MGDVSRVVLHPNDKNTKFDIAVVVPVYNEGKGVLDTIYSAAVDAQRNSVNIAIFLVINNPIDVDEQILEQNKLSSQIVIDVIRGQELSGKHEKDVLEKIETIRKSPIAVGLVDCYSKKNAPQICNVGYARDVGTRSILGFLMDDSSVVSHTDADSKIQEGFFQGIIDAYFSDDSTIDISRGYTEFAFEDEKYPHLKDQISWVDDFENLVSIYKRTLYFILSYSGTKGLFTPGSNHHYRKKVFLEVGGYGHNRGAEDAEFGMKAQSLGYDIDIISSLISTLCRFSDRTEEGHGLGFEIMRKGMPNREEVLIDVPEYYIALGDCIAALQKAHKSDDFQEYLLYSELRDYFTPQEIHDISQRYEEYSWGDITKMKTFHISGIMPSLNAFVQNKLREKIPRKPLYRVAQISDELINTDQDLGEFVNYRNLFGLECIKIAFPDEPSVEKLIVYCEKVMLKLKAFYLLKKVSEFIMFLSWILEELEDDTGEIETLKEKILTLVDLYWAMVVVKTRIQVSFFGKGEVIKEEIGDDYGSENITSMVDEMNITLAKMSKKHGITFPDISKYFDTKFL